MRFKPGAQLGPYQLVAPLGAGGMGEVYRARDTRLQRDVAVKLLPPLMAADAEGLARFRREAHLLASLNHPNIAHVYGLEEPSDEHPSGALVMELVEGPTLADRLAEGPLRLDEAVSVAQQIAEGLEYAHEQGIVHRDLKPANVKLRPDGTVKVLDFGLAKARSPARVSDSPTFAGHQTQAGIVLGTPAYMSPEQALGREVDRRADIWAFGVVLFEMLSGRRPFHGDTSAEMVAAIIRDDVGWDAMPPTTPPGIRALLDRCLQRDPRQRLRDIGEARIVLQQRPAPAPDSSPAPRSRPWRRSGMLWPVVAGAALTALVMAAVLGSVLRPAADGPTPLLKFTIPPPGTGAALNQQSLSLVLAVSPDGQHIATVAPDGIWLWSASAGIARLLDDTQGAAAPFFSPDGRHIAFFAREELRRIPIAGGPASLITRVRSGNAGTWGSDDTILYVSWLGRNAGLWHVSARGGEPRLIAAASGPAELRAYPSYLPDAQHYVFLRGANASNIVGQREICIGSLREDDPPHCVAQGDSNAIYVATGHLVFIRAGTLVAQPFDLERRQTVGEAMTLARGTRWFGPVGVGMFAVSTDGRVLVHVPSSMPRRLVWTDRNGRELGQVGASAMYNLLQIAPDGRRVAVDVWNAENGGRDLWTLDLETGVPSRITFEPLDLFLGSWAPHGRSVIVARPTQGPPDIFEIDLAGGHEPRALLAAPGVQLPQHWSPADDWIAYLELWPDSADQRDVWLMSTDGGTTRRLRETPANTFDARFSPDGRLLAYVSDESGEPELYVTPPSGASQPRRLSRTGGFLPRWRGDGRELFFLQPDGMLMAVDPNAEASQPRPLFRVEGISAADRYSPPRERSAVYDVAPDGTRFLLRLADMDAERSDDLHVWINWASAQE